MKASTQNLATRRVDTTHEFDTNDGVPEVASLHGIRAEAANLLLSWSTDYNQNEETCLKFIVILSISSVLEENYREELSDLKTDYLIEVVKAMLQLDEAVEGQGSLLTGLTFELETKGCQEDMGVGSSPVEVVEDLKVADDDAYDMEANQDPPAAGTEMKTVSSPEDGMQQGNSQGVALRVVDTVDTIPDGIMIQPSEKLIRTEESGNQTKNMYNYFSQLNNFKSALQNDIDGQRNEHSGKGSDYDGNNKDDENGSGIVPDSQGDQDLNEEQNEFEIPCTQIAEGQRKDAVHLKVIRTHGGRASEGNKNEGLKAMHHMGSYEDEFENAGILSGLDATADCKEFSQNVKQGKTRSVVKHSEKKTPRCSKRLELATKIKESSQPGNNAGPARRRTRSSTENQKVDKQSVKVKKQRVTIRSVDSTPETILPEKFKIPPDQAGCSKCRKKGCRKCRGYTLAELKAWKEQQNTGNIIDLFGANDRNQSIKPKTSNEPREGKKKMNKSLDGMQFMVSLPCKESKTKVTQMIGDMGGEIAVKLPPLKEVRDYVNDRVRNNDNQGTKVLVVNSCKSRTLKSIFARVMGIPVVSPEWIYDCADHNRFSGFRERNPHVYVGKNAGSVGTILENLDILLLTEKGSDYTKDLSRLIQSLGATIIKKLDPDFGKCDLVLYSDAKMSRELKAHISSVERVARRLRIPSHPISWLIDGIINGIFSPEIPTKRCVQSTLVIPATCETPSDEVPRSQEPRSRSLGTRDVCTASHQERILPSNREDQNHTDNQFGNIFSTMSSLNDIMCPWTLETQLHDAPGGAVKSPIRIYFQSIISMDDKVNLGDFVLLLPDPGEKYSKVARVLALWKQIGRSGHNKLFGKFQRYYRFNETSIRQMQITKDENTNRVFQTNHIEDNVPLTAVISKCHVEMIQYEVDGSQSQQPVQKTQMEHEALCCTAMYDYETGALLALHDDR